MKKTTIILMLGLLLVGTVLAGLEISNLQDRDITQERKLVIENYLIEKFNEGKNETEDFKTLLKTEQDKIKEIKPLISNCVQFDDEHCKFSIILKDVLQKRDIVLDLFREECVKINEKKVCIEKIKIEKTNEELSIEAQDYTAKRINNFADRIINKKSYEDKSIGGYLTFK